MCEGGASLQPQGSAEGGAKVRFRVEILLCTQLIGRTLILFPATG